MRTLFISFVLLLIGLAGLLFFTKDLFAKMIFESAVRNLTGLEAKAEGVRLDLGNGVLGVRELLLLNPPSFKKRVFGDAPEIYLQMDLVRLLKKERVHIKKLRLDIRELNVEKNRRGVSNVSLLAALWSRPSSQSQKPAPDKLGMPFRLDRFEFRIRHVTYNDRSGLVPKKLSVDLPAEEFAYEGIDDGRTIVQLLVARVIAESPYGNLGVNALELRDQLKMGVETISQMGEKVFVRGGAQMAETGEEVGRKILSGGRERIARVGDTTKEELGTLFGKLKSKIQTTDWGLRKNS